MIAISALAAVPATSSATSTPTPGTTGTEVPELATAKSRAFRQADGSVISRIYGAPVNYRDPSGAWRHIDTDLERRGDGYTTTAGAVRLRIPSSLGSSPISVAQGAVSATLSPDGLHGDAKVSTSTATFSGAARGVDFTVGALPTGIRHTTTLTGSDAPRELSFDLAVAGGATVRPQADGGARILNPDGTLAMVLSPSFGWVGGNVPSAKHLRTRIVRAGTSWSVRIDLSAGWIRKALAGGKRVTIDPTLTVPAATQDAWIYSDVPDQAGASQGQGIFSVGRSGVARDKRGALQFDLTSVPQGARVLDAKLAVHGNPVFDDVAPGNSNVPHKISVHEITSEWEGPSASWNTRKPGAAWGTPGGDILPTPVTTTSDVRTGEGWAYWRPTQLVQRWVSGASANHGLMLVEALADQSGTWAYFDGMSSGGSSEPYLANSQPPYLQVRYAPPAGQRRDDTYVSESLNDRTTMGVGVASGNLLLSSQDISINGVGQPLSFARTYNTGLVDYQNGAFGNGGTGGLTGDVHLTALAEGGMGLQLGDGSYYRYDGDGTGGYKPAARLEADLVRKPDGTHELTYRRSQSKWLFRTDGKLSQIVDKHQNTITLGYTGTGVLNQITDTTGRILPVTMNTAGQITKIMDPSGRSWNYTYAGPAGNRLATFTDPNGGITRYAYDSANRLKKLTTPGGRVTQISYDADNRVSEYIRITDPDEESGPTTRVRYDQDDPRCDDKENGDPRRTTVVTDPRGNDTTYCINPQLQVVTTIDAKGHEQQTTYTNQGQVEKFTDGTGTGSAINRAGYNGLSNNLESIRGAMGETTTSTFNDPSTPGLSLTQKYQPLSQTSPDGQQQFFGYNAQGDVTSVKDDQNTPQQQATLTYNPDGTIATAKDGENRQTTYGYWAATDGGARKGLLKSFAPPAPRAATTLNYDTLGRVTSATDGNSKTTIYSYDKLDRVKTTTFSGGSVVTYAYDADGNPTETTDSATGTETASFDELNRRTSETLTSGHTTSYVYDAAGNLTQLADPAGITGYGYDELNRSCYVAPTDAGGGSCLTPPSGATTFRYDGAGKRTKTSYPNGVNVDEAPDLSGKPTTITAGTGANQVSRSYTYKDFGNDKTGALVQSMQVNGGPAQIYTYDGSARLKTLKIGATPGVDEITYTYDKAGNRTGFAVAANTANTIAPYTATSTYNGANQITSQTRNVKPHAPTSETFTYDGQGNDTSNHWNDRNQMIGRNNPTQWKYQGPNGADLRADDGYALESTLLGLSRRYAPSSSTPTSFLRAPDGELLARKDPAGIWSYYVKDALGSVIGVYNASGSVTRTYTYDPDGNVWTGSSGKPEDFGYTGSYISQNSRDLYHNGLRWYDPRTARWTSADSLDQPGDLKNANPYLYVGSNPINWVDPLGLALCTPGGEDHGICDEPGYESHPERAPKNYSPSPQMRQARKCMGAALWLAVGGVAGAGPTAAAKLAGALGFGKGAIDTIKACL